MANNPIPPDQSRWGTFNELTDRNRAVLRGILDKASVDNPKRSAVEQKIGDFYASCMDEASIDKLGIQPLEPELKRIDAIQTKAQIVDRIGPSSLVRRRRVLQLRFGRRCQEFHRRPSPSPIRAVWAFRIAITT